MPSEQFVELLDEKISPVGIEFSHSLDMAQKISFGKETGERGLVDRRRMLIHDGPDPDYRLDQLFRGQQVAQPQRGIENLAQGARINDPPTVSNPCKQGRGGPVKRNSEL